MKRDCQLVISSDSRDNYEGKQKSCKWLYKTSHSGLNGEFIHHLEYL